MKKNIFITSVIISSLIICGFNISSNATSGKIKGDSIRLRKEASTDSTAIDTFGDGEILDVIEKDGEWYKVTINGYTGYIYQDYVEVDKKEVTEKKEENNKTEQESNKEENNKTEQESNKEENNKTEQENNKEEKVNEEEEKNNKQEVEKKEETNKTEENTTSKDVTPGKTKAKTTQKVYIIPNIGACAIGQVKKNEEINIIQVLNGWAYISTNQLSGWVRYEKITTESKVSTYEEPKDDKKDETKNETDKDTNTTNKDTDEKNTTTNNDKTENKDNTSTNDKKNNSEVNNKKAYIKESDVNFRKEASAESEVMYTLEKNIEVTIVEEKGDWYKVKVGNDEGYVSKDFVSDSKVKETTSRSGEGRTETVKKSENNKKVTGEDIAEYAKNYLGYPYVYAEESPSVGFDCSGLVWYVYKHFGYTVSRSSVALANDGKTISKKSDLKPGDILIFLAYNDYSRVGHVGIYIGNNEFIHANDEKTGVIITSLDYGKYPERFVSGRRIIE